MNRILCLPRKLLNNFIFNNINNNGSILLKGSSIFNLNCRKSSNNSSASNQVEVLEFIPVYHFPGIKYFSLFNLTKKYQMYAMGLGIPGSGILEFLEYFSSGTTIAVGAMGFSMGATLSVVSFLTQNTIGMMYVSQDDRRIKVSTVDFWGKRVDTIVPTKNWIPLQDLPTSFTDRLYITTRIYTKDKPMKFFPQYGKILDLTKWEKAFGALEVR